MNGKDYGRKISGVYSFYKDGRACGDSFTNGRFLGWGKELAEAGDSVTSFTVAIVELEEGHVVTTIPSQIQFTGEFV